MVYVYTYIRPPISVNQDIQRVFDMWRGTIAELQMAGTAIGNDLNIWLAYGDSSVSCQCRINSTRLWHRYDCCATRMQSTAIYTIEKEYLRQANLMCLEFYSVKTLGSQPRNTSGKTVIVHVEYKRKKNTTKNNPWSSTELEGIHWNLWILISSYARDFLYNRY